MLQGADRSGSTLVSAIIREGRLHFLTVGDSRIYLYRKGVLLQLNREHIYQEELALKAVNHIVPLQQVTGDRQAHALTSYLGIGRLTHIDRNYDSIKLEPGDRLLLASDGVFGTLSEVDMENALRGTISQAAESMGQMILKANMPYQDNNTALVVEYRG
jgi:protein phosphatase